MFRYFLGGLISSVYWQCFSELCTIIMCTSALAAFEFAPEGRFFSQCSQENIKIHCISCDASGKIGLLQGLPIA